MSGSAMFYAALRAYAENERIDREMHSELIELMQGVREEAMQDGKAIANQSRYSREEDLRMFALHQAVQSCGEHPSDVVYWASKFVEYVREGLPDADTREGKCDVRNINHGPCALDVDHELVSQAYGHISAAGILFG